jgi:histidine phosphotransferase ChpT
MTQITLEALDLAALLCSRVCHDVISPVGAIVNGLEVLDEEKDPEMRSFALDLVKKSATMASAKLQFCRLAFGAAGSAGASIDTGDAETVTRGLFGDDKIKLDWRAPRILMPKNKVKLILNLCLIAAGTIPRGGTMRVDVEGPDEASVIRILAQGGYARVPAGLGALLDGAPENGSVDAHAIQPFFTGLVAREVGMVATVRSEPEGIVIEARPMPGREIEDGDGDAVSGVAMPL